MRFDKNGAVIDSITEVQLSILGNDYVVMWDAEGSPIHIKRTVIEYIHSVMHSGYHHYA